MARLVVGVRPGHVGQAWHSRLPLTDYLPVDFDLHDCACAAVDQPSLAIVLNTVIQGCKSVGCTFAAAGLSTAWSMVCSDERRSRRASTRATGKHSHTAPPRSGRWRRVPPDHALHACHRLVRVAGGCGACKARLLWVQVRSELPLLLLPPELLLDPARRRQQLSLLPIGFLRPAPPTPAPLIWASRPPPGTMAFSLPALPYDYASLEVSDA